MYAFLTGPMLWVSFLVFALGMTYRVIWYIRGLDWRLDRVAYKPHLSMGFRGAIQSIYRWLTPLGSRSWRTQPFMATGFFFFHVGAVIVPIFLAGHNVILQERFGFSLPVLPMCVADALTILAIIGLGMLALRRIALSEVRILTSPYDWFILALSAAPFITGFIARMHMGDYDFWLLAHILTGELMLILAPFTKLSHIVLFFMSRGQLGMDFSIKRGGHVRGTAFPW